jgi:glycerol-3-phosphate acyltransferase PlsY
LFSFEFLLLLIFAYLLGSIPFSYLAGRVFKGKDIRQFGSGTVGGSMVYEHVSHRLVVPVGILDVLKSAVPTYLGLKLGFGEAGAAITGLAAMIGHNWPIFLGFTGGRGISTILGILLVLFPWGDVWLLGYLAVGYGLKDSAPWALVSMASMPALIWFLDGSRVLYWLAGAVLLITLIKRLEANRRPLPEGKKERRKIIWLRLVFDRDIEDHQAWIHRQLQEHT